MTNEELHQQYNRLMAQRDQTDAEILKALLAIPDWDGTREAVLSLAKMWSDSDNPAQQTVAFLLHLGVGHAQNMLLEHTFHNLRLAENGIDPYQQDSNNE